jgi:hypothetical protein
MDENQKSIDGVIEKLAIIAESIETLFPEGKIAIALDLPIKDFKKVQNNFRQVDNGYKQFIIEISNTQFMFLLDESLNGETNTP